MLLQALRAARDLGRLNEIAGVLVRHGLGDVARRLGLARAVHRVVERLRPGSEPPPPTPVRLRRALEELGPTFVKLGQLLASRSDLLPPDWTRTLSDLHERVEAVPFEALRKQLAEDLGGEPEAAFAEIDSEPLAAGSIAQVHAARTVEGDSVVLKVRRPGIVAVVDADLRLLERLAVLVEHELPELARYRPRALVKELARSLRDELDLVVEARNLEVIRENCEGEEALVLPRVYSAFTSKRLLVLERLMGVTAAEWKRTGEPADLDGPALAEVGASILLRMVLRHGLYHADPHPGNVMFLDGPRIGLLDFGMVGRLTAERRRELAQLAIVVVRRDERRMVDVLVQWSVATDAEVDLEGLTIDCSAFVDRYCGVSLRELDMAALLVDVTEIVRDNDLHLPADVVLLLKTFVTVEAMGRVLDPDFDMTAHLEPLMAELVAQEASPVAALRRGASELQELLVAAPSDLRALVARARRGKLGFEVELQRMDLFGRQLVRSANRMTMGLVTASLIVGTSISMTVAGGPRVGGMPVIGLLGFATSAVMGLGLIVSIWRSPRQ